MAPGERLELSTHGLTVRLGYISRSSGVKACWLIPLRRKAFIPLLVVSASQRFSTFRALSRPIRALSVDTQPAGEAREDSWTARRRAPPVAETVPVHGEFKNIINTLPKCNFSIQKSPFFIVGEGLFNQNPKKSFLGGLKNRRFLGFLPFFQK